MTGRARALLDRHRKKLILLVALGAVYCAAVETFLPRTDDPGAAEPALVVALSSGLQDDGSLDRTGAERLRTALRLASAHGVPIVTTRIAHADDPRLTSDAAQRRIIDSAGTTTRWIVLEGVALTTRDEAERLRRTVEPSRLVLVTSRLHTRRACKTFEKLGYSITCVSSGLDGGWWRIPFAVAYESAAWIKYKAKGWI